ncbi:hypothetical protein ABH935_004926 [Catenulispora sp. GAS73]|uniref:hypothetical protein n=1 Tax=Catenulispora sp. GAS73 TaxID=3156269 RepID=UPI0035112126
MDAAEATPLEIESLNLADLDVTALDARLEVTTLLPQVCITNGCPVNCSCYAPPSCTNYVIVCGG